MLQRCGTLTAIALAVVGLVAVSGCATAEDHSMAKLKVHDQAVNEIDVRIFGQFMERASFGDHGPEAFVDPKTGKLPPKIMAMLKNMEIPIIRFPGGTDIDYIDWRDMISNVPGRTSERPVTQSGRPGSDKVTTIGNHFGYDEYFAVRDELGCETIIVLNLLDGLAKRRPLDEAAMLAAGLVAYLNAPQGAKLPAGMPDWPAIRAKNGHPEPFRSEFVQIGNEIFLKTVRDEVSKATGLETPEAMAPWYVEVYKAYIRAIREVDPNVQIIIDGILGEGISDVVRADPYIKANVAFLARHRYFPGSCKRIATRGSDDQVDRATLTDNDLWWAWTSMPGVVDEAGQNVAYGPSNAPYVEAGYRIAATEWNWNGWGWKDMTTTFEAPAAAGIGAAAFIQGMMRQGADVRIATQSMLLGRGWSFASIFGDPEGKFDPYYTPQGSATIFLRKHHASKRLRSELTGSPKHPQPLRFGWGGGIDFDPTELDVLVTADADRIFIHAINRNFDRDVPFEIDLSELGPIAARATHHQLTFAPHAEQGLGASQGVAQLAAKEIDAGSRMTVTLPARTVSAIELKRGKE